MTEIAFFTRLLDQVPAAERYRFAIEQIQHAEQLGYGRAWVAQHHFRPGEGGLPSPFVFLSHLATQTSRIRLGTAVITLTLENPIRMAEDAVVADLLSQGRIDVGIGSGSTPDSFVPFGLSSAHKTADYVARLRVLNDALHGRDLGANNMLYPPAETLRDRVWQATFSAQGGARAGAHGHGLLLSRVQPREAGRSESALSDIQLPIIEAYRNALPTGVPPRVAASRTVFVADDRRDALRYAEAGVRRLANEIHLSPSAPFDEFLRLSDTHLGTPEEVAESLARDKTLAEADEVAIQVHSVEPPHELTLRSIELFATRVAPLLGWGGSASLAGINATDGTEISGVTDAERTAAEAAE